VKSRDDGTACRSLQQQSVLRVNSVLHAKDMHNAVALKKQITPVKRHGKEIINKQQRLHHDL